MVNLSKNSIILFFIIIVKLIKNKLSKNTQRKDIPNYNPIKNQTPTYNKHPHIF